jgi:hypothetical protein
LFSTAFHLVERQLPKKALENASQQSHGTVCHFIDHVFGMSTIGGSTCLLVRTVTMPQHNKSKGGDRTCHGRRRRSFKLWKFELRATCISQSPGFERVDILNCVSRHVCSNGSPLFVEDLDGLLTRVVEVASISCEVMGFDSP